MNEQEHQELQREHRGLKQERDRLTNEKWIPAPEVSKIVAALLVRMEAIEEALWAYQEEQAAYREKERAREKAEKRNRHRSGKNGGGSHCVGLERGLPTEELAASPQPEHDGSEG
jgi:hypothetical protein